MIEYLKLLNNLKTMCGICGYIDYTEKPNKTTLEELILPLSQRGPDETGFYTDNLIGLAHCRLSIIDLTTGKQPIFNETNQIIIIQNGEFYNYQDLRKLLEEKGHKFKTKSDAEILIHLYEEKGIESLKHIYGMFALALYDKKNKKVYLGRDRMGQKPLYYSIEKDFFIFASEPKSIYRFKKFKPHINEKSLIKYLFFDYIPDNETHLKELKKVPAGSIVEFSIESKKLKIIPYWKIPGNRDNSLSFEEKKEKLKTILSLSVKKRLRSDVPLGIFLSGGIDSSIIGFLMKKHLNGNPFHSFSIGFNEKSYDESFYSKLMAKTLLTKHHHFILSEKEAVESLYSIKKYIDEPFADPSIIPTYYLSKQARKYVKVVMGGDGGDELFAGYQGFYYLKLLNSAGFIKPFIKKSSEIVSRLTKASDNYTSANYFSSKIYDSFCFENSILQTISLFGSFSVKEISFLTGFNNDEVKNIITEEINKTIPISNNGSTLNTFKYALAKLYLKDGILVKVDRASMANSLEVRSPYLDHDMVEYAFSLLSYKDSFKNFKSKYILKKTFENNIPRQIIKRKKKGFAMPLSKWIKTIFKNEINETLENNSKIFDFIDKTYAKNIISEHFNNQKDNRKKIWALLMLAYSFNNTKI